MKHSKDAILYAVSNGFERASYYGIRSLLILFMIGETLKMPQKEALSIYGFLIIGIAISKLVGALFGDFLFGNKQTLILGGILQSIGCFVFCFQTMSMLYVGLAFFIIGNGFYSPNTTAQFGKQYHHKPQFLDAGFTGLYFIINIGAFLGIKLIGLFVDTDFNYGFILAGMFMLLSTLIAFFAKDTMDETKNKIVELNVGKNLLYILSAMVLSGVFWGFYEVYSVLSLEFIIDSSFNNESWSKWYNMTLSFGIAFGLILAVLWTIFYTNQFFKYFLGFVCFSLSVFLLVFLPENSTASVPVILVLSGLLLSLGETLIAPMLFATATKYTNPKYLAVVLSAVTLIVIVFNKIANVVMELAYDYDETEIFIGLSVFLLLLGGIALALYLIVKKLDIKPLSEKAEEFLS